MSVSVKAVRQKGAGHCPAPFCLTGRYVAWHFYLTWYFSLTVTDTVLSFDHVLNAPPAE